MKNLLQYIKENENAINEYCQIMDEINFEIICESFKCKIFNELVAQYKLTCEEVTDARAAERYKSFDWPTDIKKIFKDCGYSWSNITDDRVQTFVGADKEGVQLFKRICTNRSNSLIGIIILENPAVIDDYEHHKYSGIILKNDWGNICYYGMASSRNNNERLRPSQCLEYLNSQMVYHIIELTEDDKTYSLCNKRYQAKNGVVQLPDKNFREMYSKMAKENMDRYKKLAAKLKMEKYAAKDEIPEKVLTVVNSVMALVNEYSKDPIKYAKYEYDITKLLELVSDKSNSSMGYDKKWHTYGINGLMYLFSRYISAKLKLGTGNASNIDREDFMSYKKGINEMMDKINNAYIKLKQKISEEDSKQIKED